MRVLIVAAIAALCLSVAIGLFLGRATRPTARMQPKPRKDGE
jgi:hypothetical protein